MYFHRDFWVVVVVVVDVWSVCFEGKKDRRNLYKFSKYKPTYNENNKYTQTHGKYALVISAYNQHITVQRTHLRHTYVAMTGRME